MTRVMHGGCGAGPPHGMPVGGAPLFVISYVRTFSSWLALQSANVKRAGTTVSTGRGHAVVMLW